MQSPGGYHLARLGSGWLLEWRSTQNHSHLGRQNGGTGLPGEG